MKTKIFPSLARAVAFLRALQKHRTLSRLDMRLEKHGDYWFLADIPNLKKGGR
jgi:hypothetical protein